MAGTNLKSIDDIHYWLNQCAEEYTNNDTGSKIQIDLSKLQYVSPIGCTTLLSTLKFLDNYFYLNTTVPYVQNIEETNVVSYIERMNFFKLCPSDVSICFEEELDMNFLYNRQRNNQSDSLSEINVCSSHTDVEEFDSSLRRILKNKGIVSKRVSNISRIVTELGLNAIEHGNDDDETTCYYCIQSYKSGNTMGIAICDSGRGIVKSLRPHIDFINNDDVVSRAILTRASRWTNQDRGKGVTAKLELTDFDK